MKKSIKKGLICYFILIMLMINMSVIYALPASQSSIRNKEIIVIISGDMINEAVELRTNYGVTPYVKGDEYKRLLNRDKDKNIPQFILAVEDIEYKDGFEQAVLFGRTHLTRRLIGKLIEHKVEVSEGIFVTRRVELPNLEAAEDKSNIPFGMVKISYIINNNSKRSYDLGGQLLLDTQIDDQDGGYYSIKRNGNNLRKELVTKSKSFGSDGSYTSEMPTTWSVYGGDDVPLIGYGILNQSKIPVDYIRFASFSELNKEGYYMPNFNEGDSLKDDSGIVLGWNKRTVKSGESIELSTLYGVENSDQIESSGFGVINSKKIGETYFVDEIEINSNEILLRLTERSNEALLFEGHQNNVEIKKNIISNNRNDSLEITYTIENKESIQQTIDLRAFYYLYNPLVYIPNLGIHTEDIINEEGQFPKSIEVSIRQDSPDVIQMKSLEFNFYDVGTMSEPISRFKTVKRGYDDFVKYGILDGKKYEKNRMPGHYYSLSSVGPTWSKVIIEPNQVKTFSFMIKPLKKENYLADKNSCIIRVIDELGNPIEGASVYNGKLKLGGKTNYEGIIALPVAVDAYPIWITKEYMKANESAVEAVGDTILVTLYPKKVNPHILNALYKSTDDLEIDILNQKRTEYMLDGEKIISFDISEAPRRESENIYEVIQHEQVIFSSETSKFELPLATLNIHEKVYLRVKGRGGLYSDQVETGLRILKQPLIDSNLLKTPGIGMFFGDKKISTKVSKALPLIGGKEINIGLDDLSLLSGIIEIDEDGVVKIVIGTDIKDIDDFGKFKKEFANKKNPTNLKRASVGAGVGEVEIKINGIGEGRIVDDVLLVDLSLNIEISGDYTLSYQMYVGYVPIYFEGGVGASGGLTGTYRLSYDEEEKWDFFNSINALATLEAYAKLGAGVGVRAVATVGGEASISISYEFSLADVSQRVTAEGSLSVRATAFMFEQTKKIAKKEWVLYDSKKESEESVKAIMDIAPHAMRMESLYIPEEYRMINTNAPIKMRSLARMMPPENIDISIYPGTKATLLNAGDFDHLFVINENFDRETANRATLVWMTRDNRMSDPIWSKPSIIEDDHTADFNYDIYYDELKNKIYITWINLGSELKESSTLDDLENNIDISYCVIDAITMVKTVTPTKVARFGTYSMPKIVSKDDKVTIVWIKSNSILGLDSNNEIMSYSDMESVRLSSETITRLEKTSIKTTSGAATIIDLPAREIRMTTSAATIIRFPERELPTTFMGGTVISAAKALNADMIPSEISSVEVITRDATTTTTAATHVRPISAPVENLRKSSTSGVEIGKLKHIDVLIISMDAGVIGGKAIAMYEVDMDGDISTVSDREIFIHDFTREYRVTNNDVFDYKPTEIVMNGKNTILWNSGGKLLTLNSVEESKLLDPSSYWKDILPAGIEVFNDDFEMVNGSASSLLIWNEPDADQSIVNSTVIKGSTISKEGKASIPFVVTKTAFASFLSSGYINDAGKLELINSNPYYDAVTSNEAQAIMVNKISLIKDIAVTSVSYDYDVVKMNDQLPIEIELTNVGQVVIDTAKVTVLCGLKEKNLIVTDIEIGKTKKVIVDITIDDETSLLISNSVTVIVEGENKDVLANNTRDFEIGYSDLDLTVETIFQRGKEFISITVNNESPFETDAKLIITEESVDGPVIREIKLGGIDNKHFSNTLINFDSLEKENNKRLFYATVKSSNEDHYLWNNSGMIYIKKDIMINKVKPVVNSSKNNSSGRRSDKEDNTKERKNQENLTREKELIVDIRKSRKVKVSELKKLFDEEESFLVIKDAQFLFRLPINKEMVLPNKEDLDISIDINTSKADQVTIKFSEDLSFIENASFKILLNHGFLERQVYMITRGHGNNRHIKKVSVDADGNTTLALNNNKRIVLSPNLLAGQDYVKENLDSIKLILGYPDGSFKPDKSLSRGEMSSIMNKLFIQLNNKEENPLTKEDHWANEAINNLSTLGYISGYADGTFKPNNYITRAEFSSVLYNTLELDYLESETINYFDDIENHWAKERIEKLADLGIIKGHDGHVRPDEFITRVEAITLINRLLGRNKLSNLDVVYFSDVDREHWGYQEILNALNL